MVHYKYCYKPSVMCLIGECFPPTNHGLHLKRISNTCESYIYIYIWDGIGPHTQGVPGGDFPISICRRVKKPEAQMVALTSLPVRMEPSAPLILWHNVWLKSGRPRYGWVWDTMCRTKLQYKRVLRWVVRNQDKLSLDNNSRLLVRD